MIALGFVYSWGCSRMEETSLPDGPLEGVELTVKATMADAAGTRTVLNSDKSIYWTKDDAINLFYGDRSSGKFISTVGDEPVQTTDFVGTLTVATGSSEAGMNARAFWGVYPYNENNTCDGTGVTMTLPDQQNALAGSFADKLNPSVATSAGLDLEFYNVGAPFYFSVTQEGVTSATFKGNNDEDVAGKVRVSMGSDGKPVADVLEGVKSITLTAPEGGFVPGETYVIVLLPQTQMTAGYTVVFKKGYLEAACVVSKSVPFERSKGRSKNNADEGLIYTDPSYAVPEYVDLGLSVKWATFNLGATQPEEYGNYYAWGETETKDTYSEENYKWYIYSEGSLTKYNDNSSFGSVDNKVVLEELDDVSHLKLGGNWRMPTESEWTELLESCTWTWTTLNGTSGRLVTSNIAGYTDRSIFLPAAGCWFGCDFDISLEWPGARGDYWSSSLYADDNSPTSAWAMGINSIGYGMEDIGRFYGLSVRPVYDDPETVHVERVSLDHTSLDLFVGESYTILATVLPTNATNQALVWKSSNPSVVTVNQNGIVTGVEEGSATIIAINYDGMKQADCLVTVSTISIPEAIDLGLPSGLKWASMNVGAKAPEHYGSYFAWGETSRKSNCNWSTYFDNPSGDGSTFTKYASDKKTELDLEDDAARQNWGGTWRTPTDTEWTELRENCTWTLTTRGSTRGYSVTASNGKSIFLPAAGLWTAYQLNAGSHGGYWSASLNTSYPDYAWEVDFNLSGVCRRFHSLRYFGQSIRPVSD